MKILILTTLFPPDTGAAAAYVKELATRLAPFHEVHLLLYGYLPEEVSGTTITSVDKRVLLPKRLFLYTRSLLRLAPKADRIFLTNGPSVEVPFFLFSFFKKTAYTVIISDPQAVKTGRYNLFTIIFNHLKNRAKKNLALEATDYEKPELLPFTPTDPGRVAARELWWQSHCNTLTQ